jgi:hypothetical protein
MTDLLDHGGDVGVGRRLPCDKPGLEAGFGAIAVDALQKEQVIVHIEETRSITPCRPP